MSKTEIRGNKQIKDLSITNEQIETNAGIETTKLAEGQEFLKRDGSVPLTGDLDADGNKIENLGAPVADTDAARKIDIEEGDLLLQDNLDQEILDRQTQDDLIDSRIDSSELKDTEQDSRLTTAEQDINQVEIDLIAEESARLTGDQNLQQQIDEAVAGEYISGEIPLGVINGSNQIFTLANTPNTGSEQVYLNGVLQNVGVGNDYTISNNIITFSVAPIIGDIVTVNYIHNAIVLIPAGGVDLTQIESDINNIKSDINSIDNRLDIIEPEIDVVQNDVVVLDSRLDVLETSGGTGDLTQIQTDITNLENRLTSIESDVDLAQTDTISFDIRLDSIENTINNLSTVATSGSYNDLSDKPAAGGMNVNWQYFSSSGTWTKPAGAKLVHVICVGAGGGGARGSKQFDTIRYGGSGGSGGMVASMWFDAAELSNTETVTVGLGGSGSTGEAFGAGGSNSTAGSVGGTTYFGGDSFSNSKLAAIGGAGAKADGALGDATFLNSTFTLRGNPGARGRPADNSVQNGADAIFYELGCAGGASGGTVSRNAPQTTTLGGNRNLLTRNFGYIVASSSGYSIDLNTGGQTQGAAGENGLNAITDGTSTYILGGGGAGGAASINSTAGSRGGNGGNGGTPGGGGGGGGSGLFGSTGTGSGGTGGNGGVYIITYF